MDANNADLPRVIFEWIKALGAAGGPYFAYMWFIERKDRLAKDAELREIRGEATTAYKSATSVIETLNQMLRAGRKE